MTGVTAILMLEIYVVSCVIWVCLCRNQNWWH